MTKIEIAEALSQMPHLIEAAIKGEEIILTKEQQPVVKLLPIKPSKPRPSLFGSDRELITISDNFDEPLEDFSDYQ